MKTQERAGKESAATPQPEPKSLPPVERPAINAEHDMWQMAALRPDLVAKVVRSLLIEDTLSDDQRCELGLPHQQADALTPRRKVSVLAVGLGSEGAAELMKWLSEAEIELIAGEVSETDIVTPQLRNDVFHEIKQRVLDHDILVQGGADFARAAVAKAMGPRNADNLMDRVGRAASGGFNQLRNIDPTQIVPFIAKEHPQTIALILSQLDTMQAAGVLNGLPTEMAATVIYRMATMENVSPRVLRETEENLIYEMAPVLTGQITEVGGPKAVAEILNRTGRSTEKSLLKLIDAQDGEVGAEIRNQMFTFNDISKLTDREIQLVLREVDVKDLAVALKGGSEELSERIFANISEEVATTLREEMEYSGPVRMSDVEEVQLRVVHVVRQLEEASQVTIARGDSSDAFI